MEAVNGVAEGPPPPSPLTGCYLLVVLGEPHTASHKDIILQRLAKGLLSWNVNECLVDLEKELTIVTEQGLEGEEARYGERLIQFASENLVTEILIHPSVSTLVQCVRNLLSSFTRHRHIIHAGYTFAANGSWILQDGTFSLADFAEAFQEIDVQRVIRAYENGISFDIHCSAEGEWMRLPKESFTRGCKLRVNPDDRLDSGTPAIANFVNYISPFLVPAELENTLESSDVVGNIRFSRPTLYVFPGGQGDAALFGINGFNMLVDGGFSRKACFWDFVRHLDRLDAVMLTRLNNSNANGIGAVLRRKAQNAVYPQIGHFFCNIQNRKANLSPDGDKDKDPLVVNLLEEGHELVSNLRSLELNPQLCYRDSEPINLYHKVGHGTLDMYVINPAKDSKEVKEFLLRWNSNDLKLFANHKFSRECMLPLQNIVSICALLVWRPANPNDTITRILFPGSAPQNKIFEGLDRLKNLECIKHTVCTEKTLTPAPKVKSKENILDKIAPLEKPKSEIKKTKPRQMPENKLIENGMQNGHSERIVKKSGSVESDKSESKPPKPKREENKIVENNKQEKEKMQRSKPDTNGLRVRQKPVEKKPSPTTPKKTLDSKKSELDKDTSNQRVRSRISPSATPAKSTKDATNRRVLESKSRAAPKREVKESKPSEKKEEAKKVERKPISRRPKTDTKMPQSPVKRAINGVQKPDSISRKGKLDRDVTTDSSTVSTPSVDQDNLKKDLTKLTPEEVQQLKAQELAELKEEQEAIKELEAVFRKGDKMTAESSNLRKVKDISIDDKTENEEYLIVEKEIIEPSQPEESETDVKEEETVKLARDSEESEKKKDDSDTKDDLDKDRQVDTEQEESGIGEQETDIEEGEGISKEASIQSPEENKKIISKDDEIKEQALESQPDEKISANIESGATTTAPTLPEDERIPLNEIKEDIVDQIEEKHVKEETKEKETKEEIPVITFTTKTAENLTKLPAVVGIRLDKETRIRDIVKTPDEVADLPVHEEVDVEHLTEYTHERIKSKDELYEDSPVKDEESTSPRKSEESPKEEEKDDKKPIDEEDKIPVIPQEKIEDDIKMSGEAEKPDLKENEAMEKSPLQEEMDVHVETTSKPFDIQRKDESKDVKPVELKEDTTEQIISEDKHVHDVHHDQKVVESPHAEKTIEKSIPVEDANKVKYEGKEDDKKDIHIDQTEKEIAEKEDTNQEKLEKYLNERKEQEKIESVETEPTPEKPSDETQKKSDSVEGTLEKESMKDVPSIPSPEENKEKKISVPEKHVSVPISESNKNLSPSPIKTESEIKISLSSEMTEKDEKEELLQQERQEQVTEGKCEPLKLKETHKDEEEAVEPLKEVAKVVEPHKDHEKSVEQHKEEEHEPDASSPKKSEDPKEELGIQGKEESAKGSVIALAEESEKIQTVSGDKKMSIIEKDASIPTSKTGDEEDKEKPSVLDIEKQELVSKETKSELAKKEHQESVTEALNEALKNEDKECASKKDQDDEKTHEIKSRADEQRKPSIASEEVLATVHDEEIVEFDTKTHVEDSIKTEEVGEKIEKDKDDKSPLTSLEMHEKNPSTDIEKETKAIAQPDNKLEENKGEQKPSISLDSKKDHEKPSSDSKISPNETIEISPSPQEKEEIIKLDQKTPELKKSRSPSPIKMTEIEEKKVEEKEHEKETKDEEKPSVKSTPDTKISSDEKLEISRSPSPKVSKETELTTSEPKKSRSPSPTQTGEIITKKSSITEEIHLQVEEGKSKDEEQNKVTLSMKPDIKDESHIDEKSSPEAEKILESRTSEHIVNKKDELNEIISKDEEKKSDDKKITDSDSKSASGDENIEKENAMLLGNKMTFEKENKDLEGSTTDQVEDTLQRKTSSSDLRKSSDTGISNEGKTTEDVKPAKESPKKSSPESKMEFELKSSSKSDTEEGKPKEKIDDIKLHQTDDENELIETADRKTSVSETVLTEKKDSTTTEKVDDIPEKETKDKIPSLPSATSPKESISMVEGKGSKTEELIHSIPSEKDRPANEIVDRKSSISEEKPVNEIPSKEVEKEKSLSQSMEETSEKKIGALELSKPAGEELSEQITSTETPVVSEKMKEADAKLSEKDVDESERERTIEKLDEEEKVKVDTEKDLHKPAEQVKTLESDNEILKTKDVKGDQLDNELKSVSDERKVSVETIQDSKEAISKSTSSVDIEDKKEDLINDDKESIRVKSPEQEIMGQKTESLEEIGHHELEITKSSSSVQQTSPTKPKESTAESPEKKTSISSKEEVPLITPTDIHKEDKEKEIETVFEDDRKASIEKVESTESFLTRKFSVVHPEKDTTESSAKSEVETPSTEVKERSPDSISSVETSTTVTTEKETTQTGSHTERKDSIHEKKEQHSEKGLQSKSEEITNEIENENNSETMEPREKLEKLDDKIPDKTKDEISVKSKEETDEKLIKDGTEETQMQSRKSSLIQDKEEISKTSSSAELEVKKPFEEVSTEKVEKTRSPSPIEMTNEDKKSTNDEKTIRDERASEKDQETDIRHETTDKDKNVFDITEPHAETKTETRSFDEKPTSFVTEQYSTDKTEKEVEKTDEKADAPKEKSVTPVEKKSPETSEENQSSSDKVYTLDQQDNKYASTEPQEAEESEDINLNREFPSIKGDKTESIDSNLIGSEEKAVQEDKSKTKSPEDREKVEIIEKQDHESAETEKGSIDNKIDDKTMPPQEISKDVVNTVEDQKSQQKIPLGEIHDFLEMEKLHSHKERGLPEEKLMTNESKPAEESIKSEEPKSGKTSPNQVIEKELQENELKSLENQDEKEIQKPKEDHEQISQDKHILTDGKMMKTEKIQIDLTDKPEHAESVVLKSTPESPVINFVPSLPILPTDIDKTELGRKSPKEREEDVAKIVASVATVLKSEAPLEEFHKKIPLYTTELRETHITTCDSPVTEKDIKIEFHDKKDYKDEDSEFLKNLEASIEAKKDEDTKDSSKTEEPEDPGTVHRMLVTASSEDGGEEIEICPVGTITFSRSSESSGRSSPENVSRQLSQTSSILDTISDQNTVKEATEANKEPVVEEVFKVSKGTLEGALKTDKAHSAQPIYPGIDLQQEVKSLEDQIEEAVKKDKKESQTGDEKKEEKPSEIQEILTEALQEVSRDTEDIKESITGKIGHVFGSIFSSASKVSESLGHSITDSVKAVEMSIDEGLKKVESEIGEVKHKIEDVESKVVDTLVEKKEQAEHIVADHLRESVTAISDTIDKTDKAKDSLVKQTEDTLDKMAAPLRETLGDALSNLAESMKHHEEKIDATKPEEKKNEPKETISTIEDATSDEIKNWIESSGGEITQQIYPSLKDATDYVKETHTDVKEPLKESISSLISGATKEIEETLSKIQDTEEVLGKDLEKKEAEAVSGLKDTVGVLDQGILDKKNECSQKGHEISKDIDNEVTETVETTKEVLSEMVQESKKADNEISDAMKSFGEEAKKTIDDINGKMEESKKSIEDGISEAEKSLMGNIEKETDELKKTAAEAIEKSEAAAETIKDGIVNGLVQKVSDTEEQIEDFVKTVSTKGDEAIDEIKKETESCSDAVQSVKNDISAKISDSKETLKELSADMTETTESLKESAKNIAQESQASLDSAKKDLQHTEENLKKVVDSSLENLKDSVQSSAEAASSSLSHLIEKTIHPPSEKTEKDEESELEHDSLLSRLETRAESMMKSYTDEIKDTLKESAESIEEDAKLSFESIKHDIDVKDMKKDALDMVEEKQNTTKSVINDISSIVKEEIDSSLKDLAGIEKTIAQEVPKASSGVVESLKTVTDSAHSLKEDTKDAIKEVTSTISEKSDELAEKTKHEIEKKVSDLRTEVEGTKTIILEKADSLSKEIEDTKDKVEKAFTETKESVESSLGHIKQDLEKKKDAIAMAESEVKHAVEDVFDAGKKLFGGLFGSKKPKEEIKTKEVEKESTDTKVEVEDSEVGCVQKENRVASEQSGSDSCSHPEAGSRSNEGVNKDKCDLVENLGLGKSGDNSETCDISKGDVQTHLGLAVSQEKKLSISDVEIFVDEKGKDSSSKCDLKTGEKDQTEDKVKEEISTKMIPEKPHITSEDSVISRPSSHAPELDKHITDVPSKEVTSKDVQNVTSATDAQVGSDKCSDSEDDFGTQLHHKMAEQMDPMMMSFYGALPDDDRDDILDDGDDSGRSEVPLTHLHDITKAKFEGKMFPEHVSQFPVQDPMTSSFYGELPGEKDDKDPIESWGKPLGLPSPAPPNEKGTPKKERKLPSNVMAKNRMNDDRGRSESPSKNKKKINPVYVDLTYVPHHGNSNYAYVDFFKRVRARYYVFSGIEPSREVYNALLEAKQTWEDKESEVTIIPTYDTDVLGYWVAENEELLTKYKIDLSPSASRCTINLQDHETSCSAYRLEF